MELRFLVGLVSGILLTAAALLSKKYVEKAVDFVLEKVPALIGRSILFIKWEKKYRAVVRDEHRYLRFVGLGQTVSLNRPELRDVYVGLELQTAPRVMKTSSDRTIGLGETYDLSGAIRRFTHVVILGNPGAGKTTLLERLACICCEKGSELARYTPIYIPLRRCSFKDKTLVEQLVDATTGLLPPELLRTYPKTFFETRMQRGHCMILLDGLDEVLNEDQHAAAARMVETTAAVFPDCPVLVTSRLAGWRNLLGPRFSRFVLRDLSRREIVGLVIQWQLAVTREELRAAAGGGLTEAQERRAKELADNKAEQMLNILASNPRLMQIATTPLILSLMCLVYYIQQDLPKKRVKLYEDCVTILLEEWDRRDKQLQHGDVPALPDKVALLEKIALHLLETSSSEISRAELLKVIDGFVAERSLQIASPTILRFIEERSGILSERAQDLYSFTHLTFQEYFAASGMAKLADGFARLIARFRATEIEEVLLLYSGLSQRSGELVDWLLGEYEKSREGRYLIAAGRSAGEARDLPLATRSRAIDALVKEFDATTDAYALERLQQILADLGVEKEIIRSFAQYELGRELGRGGMGTVYEAMDRSSKMRVALKVLNSVDAAQMEYVRRGLRDLRMLDHPNLVKILHFGESENRPFFSMIKVPGVPLDRFVRITRMFHPGKTIVPPRNTEFPTRRRDLSRPPKEERTLLPVEAKQSSSLGAPSRESLTGPPTEPLTEETIPPSTGAGIMQAGLAQYAPYAVFRGDPVDYGTANYLEWALFVMHETCKGLHYLHTKDLVHADIKPSNIMWTGESAVILDFGVELLFARARGLASPQTLIPNFTITRDPFRTIDPRPIFGTPGYMAPECHSNFNEVDGRSDIYSLGCTLFALLNENRTVPIETPSPRSRNVAPSLMSGWPFKNERLEHLFRRMIATSPTDRPRDVGEVIEELEKIKL